MGELYCWRYETKPLDDNGLDHVGERKDALGNSTISAIIVDGTSHEASNPKPFIGECLSSDLKDHNAALMISRDKDSNALGSIQFVGV